MSASGRTQPTQLHHPNVEPMAQLDLARSASGNQLRERLVAATIGRFDIYAELGRGGMAAVYLALDLALDRKVAIKVMLPEVATGPAAVERFRREARVAASLSHPQIIPVYAVGDTPDLAWFVMKYVEGQSLDSVLLTAGAQSPTFVQTMLQQIGGALDYAHRRGVVHRDVKPANILLDEGGWFILTDFGIAKATDDHGLTSSGMIIGTPTYMSPEHFTGADVGPGADQYALGCVAYELITGSRPFERRTVAELMKAHMLDDAPSIAQQRMDCPPALAACIMRMLAKDVGARFASLSDAIHAVDPASPEALRVVTTQITSLARSGAANKPRISVPVSPVPVNREIDASGTQTPAVRAGRRRTLVAAAVVSVIGIATVATSGWWSARQRTPVPAELPIPEVSATRRPTIQSPAVDSPIQQRAESNRAGTNRTKSLTPPAKAAALRLDSPRRASENEATIVRESKPLALPAADSATSAPSGLNTSAPAPTVPIPPLPSNAPAFLQIGTRMRGAVLYIDRTLHMMPTGERRFYQVSPGVHEIQVTTNSCESPYRETITFAAGDTVRRNYKNPPCG